MPTQAPEFFRGARVKLKGYGQGASFEGALANDNPAYENKYDGLTGTVRDIYGNKFYRVSLDDDPDDPEGLIGILCYAHEMEIFDD